LIVPSRFSELRVISIASSTIQVAAIGEPIDWGYWPWIAVRATNGDWHARRIIDVTRLSGVDFVSTSGEPWPVILAVAVCPAFVETFDRDELVEEWTTDQVMLANVSFAESIESVQSLDAGTIGTATVRGTPYPLPRVLPVPDPDPLPATCADLTGCPSTRVLQILTAGTPASGVGSYTLTLVNVPDAGADVYQGSINPQGIGSGPILVKCGNWINAAGVVTTATWGLFVYQSGGFAGFPSRVHFWIAPNSPGCPPTGQSFVYCGIRNGDSTIPADPEVPSPIAPGILL